MFLSWKSKGPLEKCSPVWCEAQQIFNSTQVFSTGGKADKRG